MKFQEGYFEEELCEGFLVSKMMKRAWAAQLVILEEVKRVCQELGIECFADWGTLLGAVRHQGYIPWDDDLDIGMMRKDYELFLQKAPDLLESGYILRSVGTDADYDIVKARITNGKYMDFSPEYLKKYYDCPYVVGIDIFPIDNIPEDSKEYRTYVDSLQLLLKIEASIPEEEPYTEEVLALVKKVEDSFGIPVCYENSLRHEMKRIFDLLSKRYMDEDTNEVTCMLALGLGWEWFHLKKEWFEELIEVPFAQTSIKIPAGYQQILSCYYGEDYMTPKQRTASHDYPYYKEQAKGLKEVMEKEFQTTFSDEQMELLIEMKVQGA